MSYILQHAINHNCEYATNSYDAARIIELWHNEKMLQTREEHPNLTASWPHIFGDWELIEAYDNA